MILDANGYPIDENGNDILEDEREDEQFLSLIDEATDEELGFEPGDDFDYGMEYEDEYYETHGFGVPDSDLMGEY